MSITTPRNTSSGYVTQYSSGTGFQVAVQHEHGGSGCLLDLRPGPAAGEVADGEGTQAVGTELQPRAVTAGHQAERTGQVETVENIELAGQLLGDGGVPFRPGQRR